MEEGPQSKAQKRTFRLMDHNIGPMKAAKSMQLEPPTMHALEGRSRKKSYKRRGENLQVLTKVIVIVQHAG